MPEMYGSQPQSLTQKKQNEAQTQQAANLKLISQLERSLNTSHEDTNSMILTGGVTITNTQKPQKAKSIVNNAT